MKRWDGRFQILQKTLIQNIFNKKHMNKKKLELFLEKINLSGMVNKVFIVTDDNQTVVRATDNDSNLIIQCVSESKIFETGEDIGIYDVSQFLRFLGLLSASDIKYKLYKTEEGNFYKLSMISSGTNVDYTLSAEENIPVPKELKKEPEVDYKIKLTDDLASTIIKALDTSGSKVIYFVNTKKGLVLNIGDIKSKDHIVKMKLENVEGGENVEEGKSICFNSSYLRSILGCNKSGAIRIAMNGLMVFANKEDNIKTLYYQRSLIQKDI